MATYKTDVHPRASDLPPAVLADLLGVHIQTAVNWASHTRRDWTTYLAERVSTSHQGTRACGWPALRLEQSRYDEISCRRAAQVL